MEIYEIIESLDIVTLFQRVLVPVLMISGIGLFILVIQTRYGRIVDRIRILNSERLELIKKEILKKVSKIEKIWNDYRLKGIQEQVAILIIRGKLLKDALKYMFISIFTAIISSLLLLIEQIIRFSLLLIILALFILGMVMLFLACINVIKEVSKSYQAVIYELDTHVPDQYRIETKFGKLGDLED
ncbi:MAG: DUF2721 domain-containing protein [Candidatus Bathyarchaeota archaeon]|nr:DUF2721 domain-containing protein [Candidatus Bathyarchaeota archaeon]